MPKGERLKVNGLRNCIGERVRELREKLDLTQDQLCGRIAHETNAWADLGTQWSPTNLEIHRIEFGVRSVLDFEIIALSRVLGVSPMDLLPRNLDELRQPAVPSSPE